MPTVPDMKSRRLSVGLTQEDLARLAGTSTRTIQRIESGNGCIALVAAAIESVIKAREGLLTTR